MVAAMSALSAPPKAFKMRGVRAWTVTTNRPTCCSRATLVWSLKLACLLFVASPHCANMLRPDKVVVAAANFQVLHGAGGAPWQAQVLTRTPWVLTRTSQWSFWIIYAFL